MEENNLQHKNLPEIDPLTNDKFVPHHEFDGIRELANNPPWWLTFIFIFSLLFAYFYIAKYHFFGDGDLQIAEYENEMAQYMPDEDDDVEEGGIAIADVNIDFSQPLSDEEGLGKGAKVFSTNCAVCHLAEGQGLVGPNLTDEYWLHGGSFEDIVKVINEGVIEKGMISWTNQLSKVQIHQVSSYILTLQGTNPPNPKAPQGEKYVPES